MEIGAKVRLLSGGPAMTVMRTTAQGYIVCEWQDGGRHERMFFPELLVLEDAAPLVPPPPEVPSTQEATAALVEPASEVPPTQEDATPTAQKDGDPPTDDGHGPER